MLNNTRPTTKLLAAISAAAILVSGCGSGPTTSCQLIGDPGAAAFAGVLRNKVSGDAMMVHLVALQGIANANHGTRAVGTPGYEASVEYVAKILRNNGFDVQLPEFQARAFHAEPGTVRIGDLTIEARALTFSPGTSAEGVRGSLVAAPAGRAQGCSAQDYDGLPVQGAVVLVDRGMCRFMQKEDVAAQRGAVAVIVADNIVEEQISGDLGENSAAKIPVIGVSKADGAKLRDKQGFVTVAVKAETKNIHARNIIAQTKTGSASNVVMAGAHLDSVPEGPGIDDNGSGVAAVLETAVRLGSSAQINNAVRFGFWGAEELGLIGSHKYVASLDRDALKDIALYLNFDMLASPNPGYFTYDGDLSLPVDQRGQPVVPEGSAGIERVLVSYLNSAGKTAQDTPFDGRSDYEAFAAAGIPAGGLFSGAEEKKSVEQAKLWGGAAGQPFDQNYHQPADTLGHIDHEALAINGGGVAYAIGLYAKDLSGRNGVPIRTDRTRNVLTQ